MWVGEQRLEPARNYRVVTHEGMLNGLHRYRQFESGHDARVLPARVTEVVEAGFRRRAVLTAPRPGNVTLVKESR